MNTHADKTQENKSQAVANEVSQKQGVGESTFQFVDNRPEAVAQRKLQEMANSSPRTMQLKAFQEMANNSQQIQQPTQLEAMADDNSAAPIQGVFSSIDDVKSEKLKPSSPTYTDQQKLQIANWCISTNKGSNAIKQVFSADYALVYSTVTGNDQEYDFTFIWDLAIHIDLGGPKHGDVETPHLQAVPGLDGIAGSTFTTVHINDDTQLTTNLLYNSRDNAVFIPFNLVNECMDKNSLEPVHELIHEKINVFSKNWARSYADKHSGAKDERAQEEPDFGGFDMFDDNDY